MSDKTQRGPLEQSPTTNRQTNAPIDVVITWVDGDSQDHRRKRHKYMTQALRPLHDNAVNPHRWACSDEILYCLQSIETFAPWVRTIWIVVDDDTPNLTSLSNTLRAKIKFAFHQDVFRGFTEVLPTFNSLAIESMIWRIEGLSERFLYFNDDVFLVAPLAETDMFQDFAPVLRGKWVNYDALQHSSKMRADPAKFHHFMQVNAANLVGFEASRLFSTAHVVHPMRRKVMQRLFDQHADAFTNNMNHRFRDLSQFLPQGLHNHACIAAKAAVIHPRQDHLHIRSGQGNDRSPAETWSLLQSALTSEVKFLCVNDLPQLEALIPEVRDWLRQAVGGFASAGL